MKRILTILLTLIIVVACSACNNNDKNLKEEDIHSICELATIKCYYNNVAQIVKKKDNIFQKDREMWIEYEGEANIGIDMSKVEIKIKKDTVIISMPKAEVLSIKPIKETLNEKSYVVSADGWFVKNKITAEDQEEAIKKGQEEIKKAVNENTTLFIKAENKAKELIENYIINFSKTFGKNYNIKWK